MKKFLAIVLTLVLALSLSVTAFAEGEDTSTGDSTGTTQNNTITPDTDGSPKPSTAKTSVEFGVDPTYTITIPAKVELTRQETEDGAVTYEQEAKIAASKDVRLLNGQTIQITLSAGTDGFVLTSDENASLDYTVTVEEGEDAKTIASGDTVATFETDTAEQISTLHFAAKDPTYAGKYSDIVTFTISIGNQTPTNP